MASTATLDELVRASLRRSAPPRVPTGAMALAQRLHAAGQGLQAVAKALNAAGYPPLSRGAAAWSPVDVRLVLVVAGDPALRATVVVPEPATREFLDSLSASGGSLTL